MIVIGIILAVIGYLGIQSVWEKNEWRYPIFEIRGVLEREKKPKIVEIVSMKKQRGACAVIVSFVVYLTGIGIVYWRTTSIWTAIVAAAVSLWLLYGVISLFRAAYSPKIRLLNYLYSPYVLAWRRDHWSEYTDSQIARAICQVVGIDANTIVVDRMTIDDFLLALCKRTRPQYEIDEYPKVLIKLHDRASNMVWNG